MHYICTTFMTLFRHKKYHLIRKYEQRIFEIRKHWTTERCVEISIENADRDIWKNLNEIKIFFKLLKH